MSRLFGLAAATVVAVPAALLTATPSAGAEPGGLGLQFDGVNDRVSFGNDSALSLSAFTIETWFRRDGTGISTSTGSGGAVAVPLVTKGRSEGDGGNTDVNWFLGIDEASGVLVADFEEGPTGSTPGRNHPVFGSTFIQPGAWYHAAATYDGTTWHLYLNGALDAQLAVGQPVSSASIQPAGLATAFRSTNSSDGAFAGRLDETRIWNVARSAAQIAASASGPLASAPGLVARWGFEEGTGTIITSSAGTEVDGTLINGPTWVDGTPFASSAAVAPSTPAPSSPANAATGVATSPTLQAAVSDPNGGTLSTTFYGRAAGSATAENFTIAVLPDTQHYTDDPVRTAQFNAQTQWLADNRAALNLRFVSHLGDLTESSNTVEVEWQRADAAMDILDNAGVPNNVLPGVHDLSTGATSSTYFDAYFPPSRYDKPGNDWYGGWLGEEPGWIERLNKDNYALFSAGGIDFMVLHLEVDTPAYTLVWANDIIDRHPHRQVILVTHAFLDEAGTRSSAPASSRSGGIAPADVWTRLVAPNCNIFLVLNGHAHGEARATSDNACGQPVHQVLTNYKEEPNGGNGWLRYYTFRPASNQIAAFTYSPVLGAFDTDGGSQFTLPFGMTSRAGFARIGSVQTASGATASITWPGRAPGTTYEWYAVTDDGKSFRRSTTRTFTTAAAPVNQPPVFDQNLGDRTSPEGASVDIDAGATDPDGDPLTYAATGLPAGVTINAATGLIGGTVAAGAAAESPYEVSITVRDGTAVDATDTFTWTVTPAPTDQIPPTAGRPIVRLVAGSAVGSTATTWIFWPANDTGGSGLARFRVDMRTNGGAWTRINSSTTVPQLKRILNTGTGTSYQFRVQALDQAGNASAFYEGPVLRLPVVQEHSSALRYTGTWQTARPTGALGGTTRYATAANATVEYTFRGRGYALVAPMGPTQGSVDVWLDGTFVKTINLQSSRALPRTVAWSTAWNVWATHTVRLVVKGTPGHPRVDVDAVVLGG